MAMTVSFDYKNVHYTLGFNRNTVVTLEQQGFSVEAMENKPNLYVPVFFYGAFAQYHRGIKRNLVEEIYEKLPDKRGLLRVLLEAYAETSNALFDEPEEGDEGNLTWEQNG